MFIQPTDIVALLALVSMEIVLGIDNIVFITILSSRLPQHQQMLGRRIGLLLALVTRIALLFTLKIILGLSAPLFSWTEDVGLPESWFASPDPAGVHAAAHSGAEPIEPASTTDANSTELNEEAANVSIRDLILFAGGLFLIAKSVFEIHERISDRGHGEKAVGKQASLLSVVLQIAVIDIVFSLDSVITAVGMVDNIWIMVIAVIAAVIVMLIFSEFVARFVEANPTFKMLALSFLILIGVLLVAESIGAHLDKRIIYFAMAFALVVEVLNMKVRGQSSKESEALETSG